jgi:hypothetical protein
MRVAPEKSVCLRMGRSPQRGYKTFEARRCSKLTGRRLWAPWPRFFSLTDQNNHIHSAIQTQSRRISSTPLPRRRCRGVPCTTPRNRDTAAPSARRTRSHIRNTGFDAAADSSTTLATFRHSRIDRHVRSCCRRRRNSARPERRSPVGAAPVRGSVRRPWSPSQTKEAARPLGRSRLVSCFHPPSWHKENNPRRRSEQCNPRNRPVEHRHLGRGKVNATWVGRGVRIGRLDRGWMGDGGS